MSYQIYTKVIRAFGAPVSGIALVSVAYHEHTETSCSAAWRGSDVSSGREVVVVVAVVSVSLELSTWTVVLSASRAGFSSSFFYLYVLTLFLSSCCTCEDYHHTEQER